MIVAAVLLVVAAVLSVVVIYYRRKIAELQTGKYYSRADPDQLGARGKILASGT